MTRLTRDGLLESYCSLGRPREGWLVGAEFERHLLDEQGMPLPYFDAVRDLMRAVSQRQGREAVMEGENPIALGGPGGAVTLEPGGQFELSGTPYASLDQVEGEADRFAAVVAELLRPNGGTQVAIGYTPYAALEDIPWVPKGRYAIMRAHLQNTGKLAHNMMKGTCAVQASFDYLDEADCSRKVRLAAAISPLVVAMYANSPYIEGRPSGFMSFRGWAWLHTDPRRTGLPDAAMDFTMAGWVDYLLDVPLLFQRKGADWVTPMEGMTFRDWMREEEGGPTLTDWALHQTSVFPEVRVKEQIEVRSADSVSMPLAMSLCALFKGLYHSENALEQAEEIGRAFAEQGTRKARLEEACREGLAGQVGGRTLLSWSEDLYACALGGLRAVAADEVRYLEPLGAVLASGMCPARALLHELGDEPEPGALIQACRLERGGE